MSTGRKFGGVLPIIILIVGLAFGGYCFAASVLGRNVHYVGQPTSVTDTWGVVWDAATQEWTSLDLATQAELNVVQGNVTTLDWRFRQYSTNAQRFYEAGESVVFQDISAVGDMHVGAVHSHGEGTFSDGIDQLFGGARTMYVDGARGTDADGFGNQTGFQAYSSAYYAWDQIPAQYSGNQDIYVSAGYQDWPTNTRSLYGKSSTNSSKINFYGTKTVTATFTGTGGVQGTGGTPGTVTGSFTASAYDNLLLYCDTGANAGQYRLIDSGDTTTLTIISCWTATPQNGDTYTVYSLGTTWTLGTNGLYLGAGQNGIQFYDINLVRSTTAQMIVPAEQSNAVFWRCRMTGLTRPGSYSELQFYYCYVARNTGAGARLLQVDSPSKLSLYYSKVDMVTSTAATAGLVYAQGSGANILFSAGTVINGYSSGTNTIGAYAIDGATITFGGSAAQGNNWVRNFSGTGMVGIKAASPGSMSIINSLLSYNNNTSNSGGNLTSMQESTGAGTPLLGTNCPAVTVSAPYTWVKIITSDGSTAYIPAWK